MAIVVKNIIQNSFPIPNDTLELCKKLGVYNRLPHVTPKNLSFELHNSSTEMANAIRRCINSELEVLVMTFDYKNVTTDDNFIITHELKKRIQMIPIKQIATVEFYLNVVNETDIIIPIYSGSINEGKIENGSISKMFSHSIILTYLRPGKRLVITNIRTIKGVAYKDGIGFSFPGKVAFKCLDMDGKSSLIAEPTKYQITISRQKYIDPVQIIKMAVKTLDGKIMKYLKYIKGAEDSFYSAEIDIEYSKTSPSSFRFYNETYTLGYLLKRYCANVDETIEYLDCVKSHPSLNYIDVTLSHTEPQKVMVSAMNKIHDDLVRVGTAF